MNSVISRAYASANRLRHDGNTGDLVCLVPAVTEMSQLAGGADLQQPGCADNLDSGVVAVVSWADSGDDSDGAGAEGDGGGGVS